MPLAFRNLDSVPYLCILILLPYIPHSPANGVLQGVRGYIIISACARYFPHIRRRVLSCGSDYDEPSLSGPQTNPELNYDEPRREELRALSKSLYSRIYSVYDRIERP